MLFTEIGSALVVVAHCDDAEWMFGGVVAKLTDRGVPVSYLVVTDGASGGVDLSVTDEQLAAVRADEQRAAAGVLGVSDVTFLGYHNDELEVSVGLKRDIVHQIRRVRPDLVLTWMPSRHPEAPIDWLHGDHLAVGEATMQAIYPEALMPRIHSELGKEGLAPHTVGEVWYPAMSDADCYIDVSEVVEVKMDAIWCHHSQNGEANGDRTWLFERRVAPPMRSAGRMLAVAYAERFRRVAITG
ncbi:PIG-L deacetylase family protein [Microlunatus sp. Gsoil 973]|uniref:PIG-L deacetylase family protein n=1 Tax=Microlunatus sp. Gsoil 973 TaxID=2672569 RepID=UPI0012B48162|nr:PIG-L deacetylase family protein [Microlunatus sp. Gsoil 973]QGN34951.1 PIG-L family deacetylase [Microlunatus sp. Gsoil 973]